MGGGERTGYRSLLLGDYPSFEYLYIKGEVLQKFLAFFHVKGFANNLVFVRLFAKYVTPRMNDTVRS